MIIRSKAPLRLGLAGGGTDVSPYSDQFGGCVLNATIDMYAYCTIEATDDGKIAMFAADRGESFEADSAECLAVDGNMNLQKGVYNRVVRDYHEGRPLSFRMTTYSDALAGSGLGSSSTLVVAILHAFAEWLNLPFGEYDLASLAYEIERHDLGLSGGKQDQYAATFGGFNFMEFYAKDRVIVNPLRIRNWVVNELEASMLLFFTGLSRESAQIIDEQVANVQEGNQPSLQAMHKLKSDALIVKEALLKGDIATLARTVAESWAAKKRMAYSITNDEIELIYDEAMRAGAMSGKITGAGGGGFLMLFVDPVEKIAVMERLSRFDGKAHTFHFTRQGSVSWKV